jgi:outer membrane protein TolC
MILWTQLTMCRIFGLCLATVGAVMVMLSAAVTPVFAQESLDSMLAQITPPSTVNSKDNNKTSGAAPAPGPMPAAAPAPARRSLTSPKLLPLSFPANPVPVVSPLPVLSPINDGSDPATQPDLSSPNSLLNIPTGSVTGQPNDQPNLDQILNSTVNSTPNQTKLPLLPTDIKEIPIPQLPPELTDHNKNKTIDLGPLHTGPLIQIAALRPIRLEANLNQPITLRDSLGYAMRNALPIGINLQTFESNRYGFYSNLGGFLPSLITNYTLTNSFISPTQTESMARAFSQAVSLPVFQGGRVLYGAISQWYRMRAARGQYNASINDTLLNTYNAYYNLLLQRALLQIRIKSVEVSETQLQLNEQLYVAGTGTRFAVMQSRTQLALDRQALLTQQVAVRQAALTLAFTINMPLGINLIPVESTVTESSLLDEGMNINELLNIGIVHRPELRQYEYLRLAAARSVPIAAASLYPTAAWTITYSHTSTSVFSPATSPTGQVTAFNQTVIADRAASSSSSSTAASTVSNVPAVGVFSGKFDTISLAFNLNWTLGNLGTTAAANILGARAVARQAMLQANQVLLQVSQQVRSSYLNALTAREQIDVTATGVASSAEELRLANLRVQMGVGTNLELIQAQRDYIMALINQAQAIIASNQAQAQLLHDTGLISQDTLTLGYHSPISSTGNTTH